MFRRSLPSHGGIVTFGSAEPWTGGSVMVGLGLPMSPDSVAPGDPDGDADDLFYDAVRRRVYGCFGAGSVIVYAQNDPDHYRVVAKLPTASGARTGLFSADLRRLFVAVPRPANPTAEIRVFDTGR